METKMKKHRVMVAFFVSLLVSACGENIAPPSDADVKVGLADVLDQYTHRVDSSRELIHMVRVTGARQKFDLASVEAACSEASQAAARDISNDKVAFEKEEVAQRHLADLLSGLLVSLDENRRIRIDPEYGLLKSKLSNGEKQISRARERYNSAARSYNEKLHSLTRSRDTGVMHYVDKPLFAMAERTVHAPRQDFGALRGSLRV
ncbi:LemA family protein [Caballeronia sp. LjRoot29]|uniref:LemA family protein n=1 Tax=Caballeronia sp. LjRoot29 TaxID=3342315 RepID=UPI003ECE9F47